jgi:hypothetical protein
MEWSSPSPLCLMHHLPLNNGLTSWLTEHNGQRLNQSFLTFVCRQLCAMWRPETDIMCFNLLQIARSSYWSYWMSIGMQLGVDFLCAQMPNQHQQAARQKSYSWKRHKNAPLRCPYSDSPITWSHRNQCNWSPWKKDVSEGQSTVVGVTLWTFVHITRAGSIHRAEQ